jgi:hypothetical protein
MRFTSFGDNGWRLNCGAGDLLVGLNQADLAAPLGQLGDHVAAEMAIEEERHHRLPEVTAGHFALEVGLKGGAQDHELIDQRADLEAVIIIFCRLPADAGILVLQSIAVVLVDIKPFIFDRPAPPAGAAEQGDGGGSDFQISQMHKAAWGGLTGVGVAECLDTFQPVEPMAALVEVIEPAKGMIKPPLSLIAPLVAVLQGVECLQCLHLLPDARQIAVLEGNDKRPAIGLTKREEAVVGVEPISGKAERQAWIALLELGRQAFEGLTFAVLLVIRAQGIGDPFCGQRDS